MWWAQKADRVVILWESVPGYSAPTPSTFSLELFFDGRIRWRFEDLAGVASIVGLSRGNGLPSPFFASDFAPEGADYPRRALPGRRGHRGR